VDSLEKNIKDSLNFLGSSVIYVEKWPFIADGEFKWWEYMRDLRLLTMNLSFLQANLKYSSSIAIFAGKG
jgi:putative ABC transport system permease protein